MKIKLKEFPSRELSAPYSFECWTKGYGVRAKGKGNEKLVCRTCHSCLTTELLLMRAALDTAIGLAYFYVPWPDNQLAANYLAAIAQLVERFTRNE